MTLLNRLERGTRFYEWAEGKLLSPAIPPAILAEQGAYLLARSPAVPQLWAALRASLTAKKPLVVLPPCSPIEEGILLRQLPASAPPQAVLVLFTSGSTGEPKAVFHSEQSLLASAAQLARALPGKNPTCSLLPAWGMAGIAFHCLLAAERGSPVLFSAAPFLDWAPNLGRILRELSADFLTLNPFLLDMLLRAGFDPAWKGSVISLTAPLKRSQRAAFSLLAGHLPCEIYGMTEAAGPVLLQGKSLGSELRLSAEGELELRGKQLMLGYASNGSFEPVPEWFATGDIFEFEDNLFTHFARSRDLIDTAGRKVAPRLIEEAMESMPELAECLAFGIEMDGVERPALVYARNPGCALSPAALSSAVERFLGASLSAELRPKLWLEVDAVPRLKGGKPDRKAARSLWGYPAKGQKAGT